MLHNNIITIGQFITIKLPGIHTETEVKGACLVSSLKLTYPLKMGLPKRKVVFQPSIFQGQAVSFQGSMFFGVQECHTEHLRRWVFHGCLFRHLRPQPHDRKSEISRYFSLMVFWLVVSTHPKNISQIGSFPQVGVKIKNV